MLYITAPWRENSTFSSDADVQVDCTEIRNKHDTKKGEIKVQYTHHQLHCNHIQYYASRGRDSSVGIATRYGLWQSGDRIPVGGEIFRTRPDRPWGRPSLLYNGYRVFPGGTAAGRGADHPPPSKCRGHERVGLYLYSPSGPQWLVIGRTFLCKHVVILLHISASHGHPQGSIQQRKIQ